MTVRRFTRNWAMPSLAITLLPVFPIRKPSRWGHFEGSSLVQSVVPPASVERIRIRTHARPCREPLLVLFYIRVFLAFSFVHRTRKPCCQRMTQKVLFSIASLTVQMVDISNFSRSWRSAQRFDGSRVELGNAGSPTASWIRHASKVPPLLRFFSPPYPPLSECNSSIHSSAPRRFAASLDTASLPPLKVGLEWMIAVACAVVLAAL